MQYKDREIDQWKIKSRNKPIHVLTTDFNKVQRQFNEESVLCSRNDAGTTGDLYLSK